MQEDSEVFRRGAEKQPRKSTGGFSSDSLGFTRNDSAKNNPHFKWGAASSNRTS